MHKRLVEVSRRLRELDKGAAQGDDGLERTSTDARSPRGVPSPRRFRSSKEEGKDDYETVLVEPRSPRRERQELFQALPKLCGNSDDWMCRAVAPVLQEQIDEFQALFLKAQPRENGRLGLPEWLSVCRSAGIDKVLHDAKQLVNIFRHHAKGLDRHIGLGFSDFLDCFESCTALAINQDPLLVLAHSSEEEQFEFFLFELHLVSGLFRFSQEQAKKVRDRMCQAEELSSGMAPERPDSKVKSDREEDAWLHHIFQYYCSFGDKANIKLMNNAKFVKMCRECGVSDHVAAGRLHNQDIDLSFAMALNSAQNLRRRGLTFEQAKIALGLLGRKAFFPREPLEFSQVGFERLRREIIHRWAAFSPSR